jgi:hypothetical protein
MAASLQVRLRACHAQRANVIQKDGFEPDGSPPNPQSKNLSGLTDLSCRAAGNINR